MTDAAHSDVRSGSSCERCIPPTSARSSRQAYGEVSRQQLLSARVLAWFMCSTLAVYADKEGREGLLGEALTGLRLAT
jgi:hypothetical protein